MIIAYQEALKWTQFHLNSSEGKKNFSYLLNNIYRVCSICQLLWWACQTSPHPTLAILWGRGKLLISWFSHVNTETQKRKIYFSNVAQLLWLSSSCFLYTLWYTVVYHLTRGICSEKNVIRWFCHCANIIECTYTNPDNIVYYTPRLYVRAYSPKLQTCPDYYCIEYCRVQWKHSVKDKKWYLCRALTSTSLQCTHKWNCSVP